MEGDAKASAFELESLPQKTGAVESDGTKPQVVEHLNLDEEATGEQAVAPYFPFQDLPLAIKTCAIARRHDQVARHISSLSGKP